MACAQFRQPHVFLPWMSMSLMNVPRRDSWNEPMSSREVSLIHVQPASLILPPGHSAEILNGNEINTRSWDSLSLDLRILGVLRPCQRIPKPPLRVPIAMLSVGVSSEPHQTAGPNRVSSVSDSWP